MRTGAQQRYYDVLRREDRRKPPAPSVAASSNASTLISTSGLMTSARKRGTAAVAVSRADVGRGALSDAATAHLWDPIAQLHLDSTTVVALRELACDHRGLTALHPHFLRFEQLDSLVLDHNALRTVLNLLPPSHLSSNTTSSTSQVTPTHAAATASLYSGCRRLTRLHVSHNELRDVARDTDIPRLLLLEHLTLAHNQLADLEETLRALRRLRHLRFLDLRHNPLVDAPAYRQRCVAALPQVEVLDGLTITSEERRATATAGTLQSTRLAQTHPIHHSHGGGDALRGTSRSNTMTGTSRSLNGAINTTRGDEAEDDDDLLTLSDTHHSRHRKGARARFAKSAIAQDLDAKYATYLTQQQRERAAAVEARAAAARQKEETWEAFHAVWALSQPGMPLSEEGWRSTMAATKAGTSQGSLTPTKGGSANNNNNTNNGAGDGGSAGARPGRKSPSSAQQQQQGGVAGRPRTPASSTRISQQTTNCPLEEAAAAAAAAAGVVKSVEVPRDRLLLLPPIRSAAQQAPLSEDADLHDSPYFRTVRGAGQTNPGAFAKTLTRSARDPSPVRLAALQEALQASAGILRAASAHDGGEGVDATYRPSLALSTATGNGNGNATGHASVPGGAGGVAAEPRKSGGGGSLMPTSAASLILASRAAAAAAAASANTIPVDISSLRVIQQHKHALIPPPWEQEEGGAGRAKPLGGKTSIPRSLGGVQPATIVQEAIVEVLVLLHQLFSAEELQLLEMEYGRAELLRLLPLPEWTGTWDAEDVTSPVNTLHTARQEMLLWLRPGTAGAGAGGGAANAGSSGSGGGPNGGRRLASEERKKGGGGGNGGSNAGTNGRGGPGQRNTSVIAGSISAYPAAGSGGGGAAGASGGGGGLAPAEWAAAALAAARAALPVEPAHVWDLFLHPYFASSTATATAVTSASSRGLAAGQGKGGDSGLNPSTAAASNTGAVGNSGGGTGASATTTAAAAAAAAASDEVTLNDAEAVQQLVRPLGPYKTCVLNAFLKLLKPSPTLDVEDLCKQLWAFHDVVHCVAAVAATTAPPSVPSAGATSSAVFVTGSGDSNRSGNNTGGNATGGLAGVKAKKEGLAAFAGTDVEAHEGKRRLMKGNLGGLASGAASSPHRHERVGGARAVSPAHTPQLSILSVLTALLFHPGFVRARVQHWEKELVRMTMAAAAAAPTTTTTTAATSSTPPHTKSDSRVGSGGAYGGKGNSAAAMAAAAAPAAAAGAVSASSLATATPLSRLFHRVQELKAHATRVEMAAAKTSAATAAARSAAGRADAKGQMGDVPFSDFVHPSRVLLAYQ